VQLTNAAVVGPRNTFGEIPIAPAGSGVRTTRGGIAIQAGDFNPERVLVDDRLVATPNADVGDTLSGATVGVLDYSFGMFKLLPRTAPTVLDGGLAAETTQSAPAGQLAAATFNVENLDPGDPQSKFDQLAATVVANLRAPDLLALEEVQDNDGPTNSSIVAADQTLNKLVAAITAAGGPAYSWRQINPVDDADGGEPGGNIRVTFLFRTDRGLAFVDRPGGTSTATTTVSNVGGQPQLSFSPGRVAPTNSAWSASRKPLAAEFTWGGRTIFAIANHFVSKGGDDPLFGRWQPPVRSSETQRTQQATVLRGFVDQILAIDPTTAVVVLGDLNDFDFAQTTTILTSGGALVSDHDPQVVRIPYPDPKHPHGPRRPAVPHRERDPRRQPSAVPPAGRRQLSRLIMRSVRWESPMVGTVWMIEPDRLRHRCSSCERHPRGATDDHLHRGERASTTGATGCGNSPDRLARQAHAAPHRPPRVPGHPRKDHVLVVADWPAGRDPHHDWGQDRSAAHGPGARHRRW
jgi:hypothetical protein